MASLDGRVTQAGQLLLLLLLLLLVNSPAVVNGIGYCKQVQTSGMQPPTLPNTFQTKIEMKNGVTNTTTDIELWNDYGLKLSRMHIDQGVQQLDLYYSFITQEIFYVQTRTLQCMVFNMSTGGDLDIIIGHNVNGIITQDDTTTLLRLNPELGIQHMPGNYSVRGLPANRWYSCQAWPERGAEFEVNWYFSANTNWDNVNSGSSVPLRIEVEGWSNRSATPNRNFKQIYDFVFFRPYLEDSERVLQTPRGTFCPNRVQTKRIPSLSPILIFTSEKTIGRTEQISSVQYSRMAFDSTQKIVSYEYREPGSLMKPPFYNMGSLTVIQDFNSGVAYFIDNVLGNCSSRPIGTELMDVEDVGSAGWHVMVMKDPMKLLALDGAYQYEGEAIVRGLPVDVFVSMREIKVDGLPLNVTFEYYILQDRVTEVVLGPGKIGFGHSVPVELRIVSYTEMGPDVDPSFSYFERLNFFNFESATASESEGIDTEQPQVYNFDIGACYSSEQRRNFMLKMLPNEPDLKPSDAMNQTREFIHSAVKVLSQLDLGLVNRIRYQHPRLDSDDKNLYLLVTLLDKPDIFSQFARVSTPNQIVRSVSSRSSSASARECLEFCYSSAESGCSSVAFCTGPNVPQANCLISKEFGTEQNPNAFTCEVFVRPTNSSNVAELTLDAAWYQIESSANSGSLMFPISLSDGRNRHFVSTSAEIVNVRFDVYNPLSGRHLKQFDRLEKSAMKNWRRQLQSHVSADDCARACLDETEFDCKSVTYCYDLGNCYVSDKAAADVPDTDIVARARCDVFSANPLSKFAATPGISRIRISGSHPSGNVSSASACASLCTAAGAGNDTDACRSFDACLQPQQQPQQQPRVLCYLSSGHATDAGGLQSNATDCTHYSKSFVADFAADSEISNPIVDHMLVKSSVTRDQCARLCAEKMDTDCQGFYYCESSDCVIRQLGAEPAKEGGGGGERVQCMYWRRVFSTDGSPYQPHKPQTGEAASKGVSAGAAAAVYVACSLVGAVLGPAVLVAVMHAMGKSTWRDLKAFATRR